MAADMRAPRDDDERGESVAEEHQLVEQVQAGLRQLGDLTAARALAPETWRHAQSAVVEILVGESSRLAKLSDREREVWRLWCMGYSAKEIADMLVLSENTVNTHLQHVRRKLSACDIQEVVMRRR